MTLKVKDSWTNFSERVLDFVFPPKCSLCGLLGDQNPCVQCRGEMESISPVFNFQDDGDLDYRGSVFRYPGRAGQAVRLLKYERRTAVAEFMAEKLWMASELEGPEFDLVVPVPIHWFRLAWRGFNQADILASRFANRSSCLRRVRATRPQAGLSTAQRLSNLDGAFEVTGSVAGMRILLIDDVVTSGRTAKECAKALKLAGAAEVGLLAFCGDPVS